MKLITETGFNYANTYWNSAGKYQENIEALNDLIPDSDLPKSELVALFCVCSNAYCDLYNNGMRNKHCYIEDVRKYLSLFRRLLLPYLESESSYKAVYVLKKDYAAFEDMLNAVILFLKTNILDLPTVLA